jgi:hypothetical protein
VNKRINQDPQVNYFRILLSELKALELKAPVMARMGDILLRHGSFIRSDDTTVKNEYD